MQYLNEEGKVHPALATIIVIVLVGIVASVAITIQTNNERSAMGTTTSTSNASSAPSGSTDTSSYKNGTYKANGSYLSPGGRESIDLTVTIKNGVITNTELVQNATDRDAREYQAEFAKGYADLVVGKEVNSVKLSRVAGSSLTSNGFNSALDQIKQDAKA